MILYNQSDQSYQTKHNRCRLPCQALFAAAAGRRGRPGRVAGIRDRAGLVPSRGNRLFRCRQNRPFPQKHPKGMGDTSVGLEQGSEEPEPFGKKGGKSLIFTSTIGFFIFPVLSAGLLKLVSFFIPLSMNIPSDGETWFYLGIFIPLTITGAVIPLFFHTVKNAFAGGWKEQGWRFCIFYYFIYWCINIIFGIPFGFSISAVIAFLLSSFISLAVLILLAAKILIDGTDKK